MNEVFEKIAQEAFEDELRKIAGDGKFQVGAPYPKMQTLSGKAQPVSPLRRPAPSTPTTVAQK
jgi:hypothetical protein